MTPMGGHASVAGRAWVRVARVASLLQVLVVREIRLRYRRSLLDIAWFVLTPAAILATYGLVLTQSFDVTSECAPYLTSAWTGLVLWTFFASSVGGSVSCIIASSDLVTKVYFPRETLALAVTGASLLDLGVGVITVALVMAVQSVAPSVTTLAVVLPLSVIVVWTAAISVASSVAAVFARDVVHAVHLALRVGFFVTPVVFEASALPSALSWTAQVNPVAVAITGVREVVFCGDLHTVPLMVAQLVAGSAVLVVSIALTRKVESRISDVV